VPGNNNNNNNNINININSDIHANINYSVANLPSPLLFLSLSLSLLMPLPLLLCLHHTYIPRRASDNEPSEWELLDPRDPTRGISMTYPHGDGPCEDGSYRRSTIRIACGNTKFVVEDAFEVALCSYAIHMHSWHACPLECPVTRTGLCSSHGRCMMRPSTNTPYCQCLDGWYGDACDSLPEWFSHLFIGFFAVVLIAYCWLRFDKSIRVRAGYREAEDRDGQHELTSLIS